MKKRITLLVLVLSLSIAFLSGYSLHAATGDMAYTMFSTPEIEDATLFDTYTIDFYITSYPEATFWALCNFKMYLSDATEEKYPNIEGGGGYAGVLQSLPSMSGRKANLTLWEWEYGERQLLYAGRVYPKHDTNGNGTAYLSTYEWQENRWYRMVLHTWNDIETGTTFLGVWLLDTLTGVWTIQSYYDTKLIDSCLTGNMSLFMENFLGATAGEERDVRIKNMYVKLHRDKSWISLDTSVLSHCNNAANNKAGAHSFGATEGYFWLKSGGAVEDQEAYEREPPVSDEFTIQQPDQPALGTPVLAEVSVVKNYKEMWTVNWKMDVTSSPQLAYSIAVKDVDGNSLFAKTATRPEVVAEILEGVDTDAFVCELTVTDIYGNAVTKSAETEAYTKAIAEKTPFPIVPQTSQASESKNGLPLLGVVLGAFALLGGGAIFTVLKQK